MHILYLRADVWFGSKDTISKTYDGRFKEIFQQIFDAEFKDKFEEAGLTYFYSLIDDIVARVMKADGGFIWACKNYDGDVMSLPTEQFRDTIIVILREKKHPQTLLQRSLHGQELSAREASWTEMKHLLILQENWKKQHWIPLKAER